jgi:hypothetical protein
MAMPVSREEPARFNAEAYGNRGGYGYGPGAPPRAGAVVRPAGGPDPVELGRVQPAATNPPRPPRPDFPFGVPMGPTARDAAAPMRGRGLSPPQPPGMAPVTRPNPPSPAAQTLSSPADSLDPGSTPRMGIGMGMLRLSVDSILDAYGGTTDSGYRYGGSRGGEAVSN